MTDPTTADNIETSRAQIVDRYSGLAGQAMAGRTPTDSSAAADQSDGCFGATQYAPDKAVPDAALRASLGCGNPLAVANIGPGEIVLDLGSGGGLDVILSARRTGPGGKAYGLDASTDMLALARTNAEQGRIGNAEFVHDAEQVQAIYQAGLDGGDASFETTAPTWDAFNAAKLSRHRYTAIDAATGQVLGWVAATALALIVDGYGPDRFGSCQAHQCEACRCRKLGHRS